MGCFNGPTGGPYGGHNLPKLLSNGSMCPELYIPSALAQVTAQTPITYKYIGLEHGRECYAGSVPPNPEPSSLTGTHAYTTTCKGDSKQSCGGPIMYNLYEVFVPHSTLQPLCNLQLRIRPLLQFLGFL